MSASPAASATDIQSPTQPVKPEKEQITFRFCRECSNMLYAKEDRINNKLMFACRTCQYSEDAASACVFRNSIYNIIGETAGVTQDVGSDPTVGLPDVCCTLCGQAVTCDFCGGVDEDGAVADDCSAKSDEEEDYEDSSSEDEHSEEADGEAQNTDPMTESMAVEAKAYEPFADVNSNSYRDRTRNARSAMRTRQSSSNRSSDLQKRG